MNFGKWSFLSTLTRRSGIGKTDQGRSSGGGGEDVSKAGGSKKCAKEFLIRSRWKAMR